MDDDSSEGSFAAVRSMVVILGLMLFNHCVFVASSVCVCVCVQSPYCDVMLDDLSSLANILVMKR